MKTLTAAMAVTSLVGLSACENVDQGTVDMAGAGLAAGTITSIAAAGLGADPAWTVAAGVAGATAGALYARHREKDECAYHTGVDDQIVIRQCNA